MLRYVLAAAAVLAGVLCAAALTNGVGNTVATVLIGGGLLAFVIFLMREMGLLDTRDPDQQPPQEPSDDGSSQNGSDPGDRAAPSRRRAVKVARPDRMRGQRRRLR